MQFARPKLLIVLAIMSHNHSFRVWVGFCLLFFLKKDF